jgi:serine protease Do
LVSALVASRSRHLNSSFTIFYGIPTELRRKFGLKIKSMNVRKTFVTVALGVAAISAGAFGYSRYHDSKKEYTTVSTSPSIFRNANYVEDSTIGPGIDFEKAAAKASPAVVHIKTVMKGRQVSGFPDLEDNPFKDFFGPGF